MINRTAAFAAVLALSCPAFATVLGNPPPAVYSCTGGTIFTIPFPYLATSQVIATQTTAGVTTTVFGTVKPSIAPTSGTLTLSTACPSGSTLTVARSVPFTQPQSFRTGSYSGPVHEQAFDRLAMQIQQLNAKEVADIGVVNNTVAAFNASGAAIGSTTSVLATGSTTPRTLAARAADVINVKDYGATGNGTTDDTAAIQAAINAVPTNGGTVYFPAGTYLVSSSITSTKPSLTLRGAGGGGWNTGAATNIVTTAAIIVFDFGSATTTEHKGVQIRRLSVTDTSNAGAGGAALGAFRIRRQNHVRFDDISINQFGTGYGITLDGTGDAIILTQIIGVRARATKFGIVQIGTVTAMWCAPSSYFTGPSPNTGSIGITLTGDTSIINCAVDAHAVGIKISGDEHRIFGARLENNGLHVWIAGPTARRNSIIGNSFSSGGTTATVQIDSSATIFSNIVSNNQYAAPTVGIVDNSPTGSGSYIYEPQQNLMRNRQTVTGAYQMEMNNMRQAGAATDTAGFIATSNGTTGALQALGSGVVQIGSTNAFNVNLVRNGTTMAQLTAADFIVSQGIGPDGGGMKHKRGTAGCVTAATVGAVCTTTITWTTAFADSNYTATCNGTLITSGVPVNGGFTAKSAASITFQTVAVTAAAAAFTTVDCVGIHD